MTLASGLVLALCFYLIGDDLFGGPVRRLFDRWIP
jgi:hypothetical protein